MVPTSHFPEVAGDAAPQLSGGKAGEWSYRGYRIYFDPPPIPVRDCDWHFVPEDWDLDDRRHGHAASLQACCDEIDMLEEEVAQATTPAILKERGE